MHRTYIRSIECYRRSISLYNIQKIANALEIETYKLLIEETINDKERTKIELFEELAGINKNGFSRWVSVDELLSNLSNVDK